MKERISYLILEKLVSCSLLLKHNIINKIISIIDEKNREKADRKKIASSKKNLLDDSKKVMEIKFWKEPELLKIPSQI
jgi:hypothetical protein